MTTTHRSELVDKIADALTDEAYDGGMGRLSEEQFARLVRKLAVTAADVIVDHTPPRAGSWPEATTADATPHRVPVGGESPEPQGEPSDAQANAAARAIIEHDEDRMTCYDHPEDFCCPCGTHGMGRSEWQRHQARAALRAAGGVR